MDDIWLRVTQRSFLDHLPSLWGSKAPTETIGAYNWQSTSSRGFSLRREHRGSYFLPWPVSSCEAVWVCLDVFLCVWYSHREIWHLCERICAHRCLWSWTCDSSQSTVTTGPILAQNRCWAASSGSSEHSVCVCLVTMGRGSSQHLQTENLYSSLFLATVQDREVYCSHSPLTVHNLYLLALKTVFW